MDVLQLGRLTFAVQTEGAKIAAQLYQAGRYVHSSMIGGKKPFSASAIRSRLTGETPRALETDEIPGVQDKFAEAAVRAKEAGFDAVQIHSAHGYLISAFNSPASNWRNDAWGGTLARRTRFLEEVTAAVRDLVGDDYPVFVKLGAVDFCRDGLTEDDGVEIISHLAEMGLDPHAKVEN